MVQKKHRLLPYPREKESSYLTASAQRKRGHKEAPSLAQIKAKKFEKI